MIKIIENYYVYGLFDPRNNELRYVGMTEDINRRLNEHIKPYNLKNNTYKQNWIKSLLKYNLKPIIDILEIYKTELEALQAEIELIAYFKAIGCRLTNGTEGGEGHKHNLSTKQKLSKINKGKIGPNKAKPLLQETKDKISKTLTGRVGCNKGKKWSDDHKLKISKTKKLQNIVGEKAPSAKLTWNMVKEIRNLYKENETSSELAIKFNVSKPTILMILKNKTWIDHNYIPNMKKSSCANIGKITSEETKIKQSKSIIKSKSNPLDTETHKQCRKCKEIKLRTEFHKNKSSSDKLLCYCKLCNGK